MPHPQVKLCCWSFLGDPGKVRSQCYFKVDYVWCGCFTSIVIAIIQCSLYRKITSHKSKLTVTLSIVVVVPLGVFVLMNASVGCGTPCTFHSIV